MFPKCRMKIKVVRCALQVIEKSSHVAESDEQYYSAEAISVVGNYFIHSLRSRQTIQLRFYMESARRPEVAFILLKPSKGRMTVGRSKVDDVEVEAGSILCNESPTSTGGRSFSLGKAEKRLLLKSMDVRDLVVDCALFDVDIISLRHALLLLACRQLPKRLTLYKDFETIDKFLHVKPGDPVDVPVQPDHCFRGKVRSVGQFYPTNAAVYFDVELERPSSDNRSDSRLLLSFDQLRLPSVAAQNASKAKAQCNNVPKVRERQKSASKVSTMASTTLDSIERISQDFGALDSGKVSSYVPCVRLADLSSLLGRPKGIQGSQNSCYMDAALFSMFCCTNIFDCSILRPIKRGDEKRRRIITLLSNDIVYPLRRCHYVRADHVMKFRKLLSEFVPEARGFMEEEKDPEEFLDLLFGRIFQAKPDIILSSGESSYLFQLINTEHSSTIQQKSVVTVQELLEKSFFDLNVLLSKIPTRLILQIPRYGKEKLFRAVIPSLQLDVSPILLNHPHSCWRCTRLAQLQCKECYLVKTQKLSDTFFCTKCFHEFHSSLTTDQDHAVVLLHIRDSYKVTEPIILQLASVMCIESSHYVSFVRTGHKPDAEWIFFDSMADREGEACGHNVPEVSLCVEFNRWFYPENYDQLVNQLTHNPADLPPQFDRLVSDCYLCFYYWPDGLLYS
uniref:USP domain-containing protein n=1 Tax=Trichuris muris TaxID=70415 RepID=A0A5S6QW25_TRIMR